MNPTIDVANANKLLSTSKRRLSCSRRSQHISIWTIWDRRDVPNFYGGMRDSPVPGFSQKMILPRNCQPALALDY